MSTLSASQAILDIYVSPRSLFDGLKSARGWSWFAVVLLFALLIGTSLAFFSGMSTEWIVSEQINMAGDLSPAEAEKAREILLQSAEYTGIIGASSNIIFLLLVVAVLAGYFLLIGSSKRQMHHGNGKAGYGDWFSFSLWTQMPLVINLIGFLLLFITANTADLPLSLANYASLNHLLLGLEPGDGFYLWAESFNLFYLWSIALAAIGLQSWIGMQPIPAYLLAAVPYVLVFGLWGILI